ncbi:MAG: DUF3617 domain-containing protein [Rhodoferax sp.]|nr:DUF3617 domain-containing protein [Rhodoferax sp.]
MKYRFGLLAAITLGLGFSAGAQTLKPGLWEISNKTKSSNPQTEKAMADMQKQLASMPADQRKMMQDMMAKQGIGMSTDGAAMMIKICLTPDMVERNELPAQQGDCKHTMSPRVGNVMKMSFSCTKPPSSGQGQMTFESPQAYTTNMVVNSTVDGKPEQMTMDSRGKWLSSDCGNVQPIKRPKP